MTRRLITPVMTALILTMSLTELLAHEKYRIVGTVTRRQDAEIQVKTSDGSKFTIYLEEETIYQRQKKKVAKAELKVGQSVVVDALGDGEDDLGATVVNIVPPIKSAPAPTAPRG